MYIHKLCSTPPIQPSYVIPPYTITTTASCNSYAELNFNPFTTKSDEQNMLYIAECKNSESGRILVFTLMLDGVTLCGYLE
jgi:hypothetical protein